MALTFESFFDALKNQFLLLSAIVDLHRAISQLVVVGFHSHLVRFYLICISINEFGGFSASGPWICDDEYLAPLHFKIVLIVLERYVRKTSVTLDSTSSLLVLFAAVV